MKNIVILLVALILIGGCAHSTQQSRPLAPPAEQAEEREASQPEKERGSKAAWFVLDVVEMIIWINK